jgi:putative exporter of polyketide antibiotics
VTAGRPPLAGPATGDEIAHGSFGQLRLTGPGRVFGKALRDSRRAVAFAIAFLAFVLLVGAAAIASAFGTAATRQEMVALANTLPSVFQSMLGPPVALDTLGGLIAWRYQVILAVLLPVWSILALSGTLAAEADRGSLDLLATTGITRRRLAIEKVAAHLVAVAIATAALGFIVWAAGVVFATLPGDAISPSAAGGYALLTAVLMLAPGSVAFVAGPFVGRGAAAGLAAFVMVAGYLVNGFRDSIAVFDSLAPLSWYSWTANHIPLAGREDWAPGAGWASEETSGRLEVLLAAPMSRVGWFIRSGLGTYLAIVLATAIVSLATALGAAGQGSDPGEPARGTAVLGLYGLAFAGVGLAIGGVVRSSLAASIVIVLTVGSFLITLFATALKLPDWVADLALGSHYGKPLVGDWDPVGVVASLVLAFGGLAVGAWGLTRRDIRG